MQAKSIITRAAAMARINRLLAKENAVLKRSRTDRDREQFGPYFLLKDKSVADSRFTLKDIMERYGCLEPYEELENDE